MTVAMIPPDNITLITFEAFQREVGLDPVDDQDEIDQVRLRRLYDMACRMVSDRTVSATPKRSQKPSHSHAWRIYLGDGRTLATLPPLFPTHGPIAAVSGFLKTI